MTLASTLTNNTKTQTTATPSKKREWSSPQVRTAGNQSQHRQYILLFLFLSSWKMCEKPFSWSKVGIQEIPSVFACTFSTFSKHMPQCTLILLCCSGSPIPLPKHLASFAYTHPFLSPFFLLLSFFFDPHGAVWLHCEPIRFSHLLALFLPILLRYIPTGRDYSPFPSYEGEESSAPWGGRISPPHPLLRKSAKFTRSMPEAAPGFLPRIFPLSENTLSWLFFGLLISLFWQIMNNNFKNWKTKIKARLSSITSLLKTTFISLVYCLKLCT